MSNEVLVKNFIGAAALPRYRVVKVTDNNQVDLANNGSAPVLGVTNISAGANDYCVGIAPHAASSGDGQPQLTITGAESIAAGGSDEYVVSLVNNMGRVITGQRDVYVYLDCNEGYIPRRELLIDHVTGKAKFTAMAAGLIAGDTMTLEAGFKHYTAAIKHIASVI